jgi:hypothetical protein
MRSVLYTILLITINQLAIGQDVVMTNNHQRIAGDNSLVGFQIETDTYEDHTLRLVVFHNFGISTYSNKVEDCLIGFNLTQSLTDQSGEFSLRLYDDTELIAQGLLLIGADTTQLPLIDALCGPKQILIGGEDHTALVSTTLDSLDNPWPEGTSTRFDYVFKDIIKTANKNSKPLYTYHRFYSDNESGNAVISVQSQQGTHKEFDLTLYPNFPQDFSLIPDRDHYYADGKQVTEINTSRIVDRFGNVTPDGTIVNFIIEAKDQPFQTGIGRTINGVATLKIPAPLSPIIWNVSAQIDQFAKSDQVAIDYQKAIAPFTAKELPSKIIEIGPITSFIGQLVPDHTRVDLQIFQNGELHQTIMAFTKNGIAHSDLTPLNLAPCTYEILVNCGGEETMLTLLK